MINTYIKSKNREALEAVCQSVVNSIAIQKGRPAYDTTDEAGAVINIPEAGDPEYWYTCVRAAFIIQPYDEVEACTDEEGSAVVGVWA